MTVQEFIAAEAAKPFAWGETDCASIADRWAMSVLGFSPMDHFGRRHITEIDAKVWLAELGSIAVAFNRVMRASGLCRTKEPIPGDLGLVVLDDRMCIAIHTGKIGFSRP